MKQHNLMLRGSAFRPDTFLPTRHTCDGQNVSPDLEWLYVPAGVESYALIMEDIDARDGPVTHWVLFDLPGDRRGLPVDADGVGVGGRNDFQHHRYTGPCPPPNRGQHRYVFRLYALSVASLGLAAGAERSQVEQAIGDHVVAEAALTARYERRTR
jgi:Raf kinase inhibitor-like YbhB/YbcL family protein